MRLHKALPALLAGWMGFVSAAGAARDAGLPGEFLNVGVGARPLAMGKAFTGVADDVNAIYWNPAGLSWFRSNQVTFQHTPLLDGGAHQWLGYAQPIYGMGHVGVGIVNLTSGDVDRIDATNPLAPVGTFKARETAYLLSYAYRFGEILGLGTTLKMSENTIDGASARGFGADIGSLVRFNEYVRFGTVLHNAFQPKYKYDTAEETFPRILRAGPAVDLFDDHLKISAEAEKTVGTSQALRWHTGLEGWVFRGITLRGGMDQSEITGGIGLKWGTFQFDYAMGFRELDVNNRFSVTCAFGGYELDVLANPRLFSPVGFKNVTTFSINATNRHRIVSWVLEIRNSRDQVVKSFSGHTNPPRDVQWNGQDEKGRAVSEGRYTYRMTTTDRNRRIETTPTRVIRIMSPTPFEMEAK